MGGMCGLAWAGDTVIGQVVRKTGQVSVWRGELRQMLEVGDPIYPEDVLRTGLVGRVEVRFVDDTSITLADRTTFSIKDYGLTEPYPRAKFQLLLGAVRTVSGTIAQTYPEGFSVSTPVATIGIRGTDFWAGTLDGLFNVVLLSGAAVVVENPRGRVELTRPGQSTQVEIPGVAPPDPDAPEEEVANILGQMARQAQAPANPSLMPSDRLSQILNSVAF